MLTVPPDTFKTFEEIVLENGYIVESHMVTTEDGFINKMHRIYKDQPYKEVLWCGPLKLGNDPYKKLPKPIIYMQHGIADSSDTWIMNVKEKSPAFVAAEEGYDVWLGNSRGNKYSHFHKTLNPETDKEYWENSFTDVSKYDIPANINHIRYATKIESEQKISIVAHSQGSTDIFYGLATNPKFYEENINLLVALGPIARITILSAVEKNILGLVDDFAPFL